MVDVCDTIVKSLEKGGKGRVVYLYGNQEAPGRIIEAVKEQMADRGKLVRAEVKSLGKNSTAVIFTTIE